MGGWGDTGCHMSELVLSQAPWEFILPPSSGQRSRGKLKTGTGGGDGGGLDHKYEFVQNLWRIPMPPYTISETRLQ